MLSSDGRVRVVIEGVRPEIDCGAFPVKRIVGDSVTVQADIFTDGHDLVAADLLYRHSYEQTWQRTPMEAQANDRWSAQFAASQIGRYHYTIEAWIDRFGTWRSAMRKRIEAGQDL